MQLLIFGTSGFIGNRFIEMFCDKYDIIPVRSSIHEKYLDLTVYDRVLMILNKYKPDAVLNLAGKFYHKTQDDAKVYESNLLIQLNLHHAINQLNLNSKVIFTSSSSVYKNSIEPVEENSVCLPINTYSKAKYIQERIGLSYHPKQHVVVARLFNVIGPYQSKIFFIPTVIDQIVRYKNHEISTVKLLTLNAVRDFIFINDVCSAISILIDKGVSGEIYNICSGEGISLKRVIELLKKMLKISRLSVETQENYVKEGINYQVGSNRKIRELGWSPAYSLKDSLEEIIRGKYED